MAVGSQQYAITSTPAVIAAAPAGPQTGPAGAVWLLPDASADVYLGGEDVSSDTGFALPSGTDPVGPIPLFSGDVLYAVTADTATVGVLQT